MNAYHLDLPWPRPPLNHNQRLHWARKARIVADVRQTVGWLAKSAHIPACGHITVQLHYAPGHRGRLDPMNLTATSKPAIDALVDVGVVVDDSGEYVHEEPPKVLWPPEPGPRCWLVVQITNQAKESA